MTPESDPPDFTTYWARIGSREASNSFCTPSSKTHFPYWTASSRVRMSVYPILTTSIPYGCSLLKFLMNLFAWYCGSIIKGHLRVLSIIIPFYVELSSFGSYAIFQACIFTGSPKKPLIVTPSLCGKLMLFSF